MTSATSAPRSDLGFRLMKTRPLLSVVLTPSTPMKEETRSTAGSCRKAFPPSSARSEEHTSELQTLRHHVSRLLLETKSPLLAAPAAAAAPPHEAQPRGNPRSAH